MSYKAPMTALPQDTMLDEELMSVSEDMLVEMANLEPSRTGLEQGVIFISTQMGKHGPRVKFFLKPGKNQPSFSVSISATPSVVANSLPTKVLNQYEEPVKQWVRLNHVALRHFWDHGDTLTHGQVQQFIDQLQSL